MVIFIIRVEVSGCAVFGSDAEAVADSLLAFGNMPSSSSSRAVGAGERSAPLLFCGKECLT